MFDMNQMLGKMQEIQAKMKEVQDNLGKITTSAESGGGMVKATVNGKRQVVNLEIDKDLLKPEDQEMLEDLSVAAINRALEDIEIKIKEEMRKQTQGVIPNIPGFDFGNMM